MKRAKYSRLILKRSCVYFYERHLDRSSRQWYDPQTLQCLTRELVETDGNPYSSVLMTTQFECFQGCMKSKVLANQEQRRHFSTSFITTD